MEREGDRVKNDKDLKAKTLYDSEQSGNDLKLRFQYNVERRRGENLGDETRILLGKIFHSSIILSSSQDLHYNNLIDTG